MDNLIDKGMPPGLSGQMKNPALLEFDL